MVQPLVLHWVPPLLTHFYGIMKKDGQIMPRGIQTIVFYRRYVDDISVLLGKEEHLKLFLNYFILCHENIKFLKTQLTTNDLFQILKSRDKNQFITSVYHKPTFSGVFSHFDSFIPRGYKFNLVLTLIFCCCSICCTMELFHREIMQLKEIFEKSGYDKFFDRCLRTILSKIYSRKFSNTKFLKRYIFLPCLGKLSLSPRSYFRKNYPSPCVNLKVVF